MRGKYFVKEVFLRRLSSVHLYPCVCLIIVSLWYGTWQYNTISRTLVAGALSLCRDAIGVFNSPSGLGWPYNCVRKNGYRQISATEEKMQWDIKNIVMIIIKHLQRNKISALNNPFGVDMPKEIKVNHHEVSTTLFKRLSLFFVTTLAYQSFKRMDYWVIRMIFFHYWAQN